MEQNNKKTLPLPLPLIIKSVDSNTELYIQRDDEQQEVSFSVVGKEIAASCNQIDFKTFSVSDIDMLIDYIRKIKDERK